MTGGPAVLLVAVPGEVWTVQFLFVLAFLLSFTAAAQSEEFVSLVPENDISEHWILVNTPPETWSIQDGVIVCKGEPRGYLRSKQKYKNFVFRAEWRFQKEGWTEAPERWPNAGFFIFAGEEYGERWPEYFVEVQGHYGEAGSLFGGGIQGAKRGPIVKDRIPFGDWDRYEITARNGHVRVMLNGELVNEGWEPRRTEGYICLQSEGWPVFYRNVEIKELRD